MVKFAIDRSPDTTYKLRNNHNCQIGPDVNWQVTPTISTQAYYTFQRIYYDQSSLYTGDGMALVGGAITNPATIAGFNFQPLPDVTSMLNMNQITGQYKFRPNITVIFGYAYEKFDYADLMNTAGVTQYGDAILPYTLTPNAAAQVVGAEVRVRF